MRMYQAAFDTLQGVADELLAVQTNLDRRRTDPVCAGDEKSIVNEARAQSEKTYLLRLLAEFEGTLTRLGPYLNPSSTFTNSDGLSNKLNRIGANMNVDQPLRNVVDQDIRAHRNELAHGRSPVPRVSFERSHDLMKAFLRYCR